MRLIILRLGRTHAAVWTILIALAMQGQTPAEKPTVTKRGPARIRMARPEISVRCALGQDNTPCELDCTAENRGDTEARVVIGFESALPVDSVILADPELDISLEPSANIRFRLQTTPNNEQRYAADIAGVAVKVGGMPLPVTVQESSILATSFKVVVPLLPPNTKADFKLLTTNGANVRACAQFLRLRPIQRQVFDEFRQSLITTNSIDKRTQHEWDLDPLQVAIAKSAGRFRPSNFVAADRRGAVFYKSRRELRSLALTEKLTVKFKSVLNPIVDKAGMHQAPVFLAKHGDAAEPIIVWVPHLRNSVDSIFMRTETGVTVIPKVPEKYTK